jgi:hypothetical protein
MGVSLSCGVCGCYRVFEETIRVYNTPEQVLVNAWPCWCWDCDAISLAEYIPDPAEIIEEARAWKRRDRERGYWIACGPIGLRDNEREPAALEYYDAVLAWRNSRQSPGRCLYCESVRVTLPVTRYGTFEHPGCAGKLECLLSIAGSIRQMTKEVFSAEGIKLSEEQIVA